MVLTNYKEVLAMLENGEKILHNCKYGGFMMRLDGQFVDLQWQIADRLRTYRIIEPVDEPNGNGIFTTYQLAEENEPAE